MKGITTMMKKLGWLAIVAVPFVVRADLIEPTERYFKFVHHGICVPLFLSICLSIAGLVILLLCSAKAKSMSAVKRVLIISGIGVATFLLSYPVVKCQVCEGRGTFYHFSRRDCRCCGGYGSHSILRGLFSCASHSYVQEESELRDRNSSVEVDAANKFTDK